MAHGAPVGGATDGYPGGGPTDGYSGGGWPDDDPAGYPQIADEPSLDDDDAPAAPGDALTGEAAAVELLRTGLGATIIEQRPVN
ncbi:MAG: hypothetical protein IRZ08_20760 [Frankia sp.]|nr:hypothetical protein [Frankia sp.]